MKPGCLVFQRKRAVGPARRGRRYRYFREAPSPCRVRAPIPHPLIHHESSPFDPFFVKTAKPEGHDLPARPFARLFFPLTTFWGFFPPFGDRCGKATHDASRLQSSPAFPLPFGLYVRGTSTPYAPLFHQPALFCVKPKWRACPPFFPPRSEVRPLPKRNLVPVHFP